MRSPMTCIGRGEIKATILLVDDAVEIRRYLRTLLELDSYRVLTASNGYEALEVLGHSPSVDVVLLDLHMPGMDGLEVLRQLRKLGVRVKVIMCSGEKDPEKIFQALSLGAHAYILKPIQHLYLSAAVERCLQQGTRTRSKGRPKSELFLLPSRTRQGGAVLSPNFKS